MNEKEKDRRETRRREKVSPGRRVLKALRSVKLTISLLAVIAVVLIVATVIRNQSRAQRYIYHSWWFISLLGLFCLNLVLCTAGRWSFRVKKLGTTVTHAGVLVMVMGVVIGGISGERGIIALYIGHSGNSYYAKNRKRVALPFTVHLEDFKVERYRSRGVRERLIVQLVEHRSDGVIYETEQEAREKQAEYEAKGLRAEILEEEGGYMLSSTRVVLGQAFPVEAGKTFRVGGTPYSVTIMRYEPDFVILGEGVYGSRSSDPENPAIQVRVEGGGEKRLQWVFARFHGLHRDPRSEVRLFYERLERIKAYKSKVRLFEGGEIVASKTIEVNKPLKYRGYSIYQVDYDEDRELYSVFEIARDPGVGFVYLGFVIISAGVVFTFYFRPLLLKRAKARGFAEKDRG